MVGVRTLLRLLEARGAVGVFGFRMANLQEWLGNTCIREGKWKKDSRFGTDLEICMPSLQRMDLILSENVEDVGHKTFASCHGHGSLDPHGGTRLNHCQFKVLTTVTFFVGRQVSLHVVGLQEAPVRQISTYACIIHPVSQICCMKGLGHPLPFATAH